MESFLIILLCFHWIVRLLMLFSLPLIYCSEVTWRICTGYDTVICMYDKAVFIEAVGLVVFSLSTSLMYFYAAPREEDSECRSCNKEVPKCISGGWPCDVSPASTTATDNITSCPLLHMHCRASIFLSSSRSLPPWSGSAILLCEQPPANTALR
jgi:hypothetical protein